MALSFRFPIQAKRLPVGIPEKRHTAQSSSLAQPMRGMAFLRIDDDWLVMNPFGWPANRGFELPFLFMDLDQGVQENSDVTYASNEVVGRGEGYRSYLQTGNKEFPLVFKFQAQGLEGTRDLRSTLIKEVREPALWLDALKYPWIGRDGLSHSPPPVLIEIGDLLAARAICSSAEITWQAPFDPDTMLPHGAEVQCSFTVVRNFVQGYPWDNRWT